MLGQLERAFALVAEQRSGLAAPVTSNDVRVPELRISDEKIRGDLLLIGDEVVTAQDFPCGRSNGLSVHNGPQHGRLRRNAARDQMARRR